MSKKAKKGKKVYKVVRHIDMFGVEYVRASSQEAAESIADDIECDEFAEDIDVYSTEVDPKDLNYVPESAIIDVD